MIKEQLSCPKTGVEATTPRHGRLVVFGRYWNRTLILAAVALFVYGLAWNYSTRKYLKGFSDAIIPLDGSPEEKSESLLTWFRKEPERRETPAGESNPRDPIGIVQDARLLKVCGSSSSSFINLAEAAGLRARRLLLLDSGKTNHVVVEVKWDERWVVVDPSFRMVFRDHSGRALSKEELANPATFREVISIMPTYNRLYDFDEIARIHLGRIPFFGDLLRRTLNYLFPTWEDAIDWGYFPVHPPSWPMLASFPLFLLGFFVRLTVHRHGHARVGCEPIKPRHRLMKRGRLFLDRSV